jgi:hypothetical protein
MRNYIDIINEFDESNINRGGGGGHEEAGKTVTLTYAEITRIEALMAHDMGDALNQSIFKKIA